MLPSSMRDFRLPLIARRGFTRSPWLALAALCAVAFAFGWLIQIVFQPGRGGGFRAVGTPSAASETTPIVPSEEPIPLEEPPAEPTPIVRPSPRPPAFVGRTAAGERVSARAAGATTSNIDRERPSPVGNTPVESPVETSLPEPVPEPPGVAGSAPVASPTAVAGPKANDDFASKAVGFLSKPAKKVEGVLKKPFHFLTGGGKPKTAENSVEKR